MKPKVRVCELCNQEAKLYCNSDAAFLCFDCDSKVHKANFLVARHVRRLICCRCKSPAGNPFSGTRSPALCPVICFSCSPEIFSGEEMDSISSSSSSTLSSACISSTDESQTLTEVCSRKTSIRPAARFSGKKWNKSINVKSGCPSNRVEGKTEEGIFANWCKKLGLNSNLVVTRATHALSLCMGRLGRELPSRVRLAASFWFGLRWCGKRSMATWQNLMRLEEVSGVPAKVIVAVEVKLEQVLRNSMRSGLDLEEGWAECSV